MKKLKQYIREGLRLNIDDDPYQYHPTTWNELRQIIEERFEELGTGIEQEPIDFNDIDVSGITTFYNTSTKQGIFEQMEYEYIDVSDWNVSQTKDMDGMFMKCMSLRFVGDLSNWDVLNVKNMSFMFYDCKNLKSVGDLSNWDTRNVNVMYAMFNYCEQLESIGDISNWNVSNVEDMSTMFYKCKKLESVGDLSKWDISNIHSMNLMFENSAITNIPDWYKI